MGRDTSHYGQYYWCVGLKDPNKTEINLMADEAEVTSTGALQLWGKRKSESDDSRHPNLILAADEWAFCYAASVLDGHAVAVDHWPGQIVDRDDD